ncbi:hypothetical protein ACLOJK_020507 [Asimina triloba]
MKSVVRTADLSVNRPRDFPLLLEQRSVRRENEEGMGRSSSRARRVEFKIPFPLVQSKRWEQLGSYHKKVERAKKRQIFLRSYNLSFHTPSISLTGKITDSIRKVKSAVLSILTSIRWSSLTSSRLCRPSALCAFHPKRTSA